jgi:hypothetical protein
MRGKVTVQFYAFLCKTQTDDTELYPPEPVTLAPESGLGVPGASVNRKPVTVGALVTGLTQCLMLTIDSLSF